MSIVWSLDPAAMIQMLMGVHTGDMVSYSSWLPEPDFVHQVWLLLALIWPCLGKEDIATGTKVCGCCHFWGKAGRDLSRRWRFW